MPKRKYVSIPTAAKEIGVTPQYVRRLVAQGRIPARCYKKEGARYMVNAACAKKAMAESTSWINKGKKNASKQKPKQVRRDTVIKQAALKDITLAQAQTIKEQYMAALKKLEYEQKSKLLIPADDVRRDAEKIGGFVKSKLQAIPARIAALVAVEPDSFECEQILKKEINQILEELST